MKNIKKKRKKKKYNSKTCQISSQETLLKKEEEISSAYTYEPYYEHSYSVLVETLNSNNPLYYIVFLPRKKIGRNEQCPCGSGKKYKKCCGALTSVK